jgi:hypothetical protein
MMTVVAGNKFGRERRLCQPSAGGRDPKFVKPARFA